MAQLLIRDIPPEVVSILKERAKRNRRSLQSEARLILEQAVDRREAVIRMTAAADEMRKRLEGTPQIDSAEIIHEMRYGPNDDPE
jgi:plasmid stability protein